jgi:hypothetical protein
VVRDELSVEDVAIPLAVVSDEHSVREPAHVWVAAGTALRMRLSFRSAASASVWTGISAGPGPLGWRVGVGLDVTAPAEQIRLDHPMAGIDVKGLAAVTVGRWDLGFASGPSFRVTPTILPAWAVLPVVGLGAGYRVPLGDLAIRIGLGADMDLAAQYFPGEVAPISRLSAALGVSIGRF